MNGRYYALWIDVRHEITDPAQITPDALTRLYAAGWRDAMRSHRDWFDAARWRLHQFRQAHPDGESAEVVVRLVDGERQFTFDEFEAWLDTVETIESSPPHAFVGVDGFTRCEVCGRVSAHPLHDQDGPIEPLPSWEPTPT